MSRNVRVRLVCGLAALVLCFPAAARADAGIPMLPVRYPVILLFLLPVILMEAVYLSRALGTNWRRTTVGVTIANVITMALGYPLAYALNRGLDRIFQFPSHSSGVFTQLGGVPVWIASRLFPDWQGTQNQTLAVMLLYLLLLLPSYLLSGYVKAAMVRGYDLLDFKGKAKREMWIATRLSYLFLAGAGCALLYLEMTRS